MMKFLNVHMQMHFGTSNIKEQCVFAKKWELNMASVSLLVATNISSSHLQMWGVINLSTCATNVKQHYYENINCESLMSNMIPLLLHASSKMPRRKN